MRATASGGWAATSIASLSAASSVRGAGNELVDQAPAVGHLGVDLLRGQQRVLGDREPAEGDQPRRADRDAERGAGEAQTQVETADAQVAGDGDLGATADAGAVAGGDGRLRKAGELVVELREELHPADLALGVELLADVGARGEAHVVGRGDDEGADLVVRCAARSRWPRIASSIAVLIALRASGRSSWISATASATS